MAQKDEMSPRALKTEELENVNGGSAITLSGKGLPTVGKPVDLSTGGRPVKESIVILR